ncbi:MULTISPECIES: DUF6745 domain-containing protein [Oscillatoriales]|uniref:DUF6745 domain-containing protein n=1 Tax=Planktothrix sp. FACHB-1355 TaxID=2692854 RepID=UPI001F550CEF|nr:MULTISPECIES: hypothetical protein [Oscillatoriales]
MIAELTPEQEALIPVYLEKWRSIALSTEPIDRQKASEAVKAVYEIIGEQEPLIVFFDSPYSALSHKESLHIKQVGKKLKSAVIDKLWKPLEIQLGKQVDSQLKRWLHRQLLKSQMGNIQMSQLREKLAIKLEKHNCIRPEIWSLNCCKAEFYINVLNCQSARNKDWQVLQTFLQDCGWIIPYKKLCIICDRPRKISLDDRGSFHAEGEPAIAFVDEFNIYAYRGVRLPEKYSKLPPSRWQTQWIAEEIDARLRRVLAEGCGYKIITEFTPEQEALIPVYKEKWDAILLSTERIDRQKAQDAIKSAYGSIGKNEVDILFYDSPYAAAIDINKQGEIKLGKPIRGKLDSQLAIKLWRQVESQLEMRLKEQLWDRQRSMLASRLEISLRRQMSRQLQDNLWVNFPKAFIRKIGTSWAKEIEFYITVLGCQHNFQKEWELFQLLVKNAFWILAYENVCFVCDRPTKINFDARQRLHAEGEPALEFADGYSLYAYHGVNLPRKYGYLHPKKWRSQWLLQETNAELRRVLIQAIGYERICQELQTTELDLFREYTLLKIDDADVEPIHLLKMTCPSTGQIHALRVPPNLTSAREAIRWVNWGIDPEKFAIET